MTMESVADLIRWQGLDLTHAIRILRQAGRADPTKLDLEPHAQIQALLDSLCDLSIHDGLTELVNATFFQSMLAAELDRSRRSGRTCALLLVDLDHFKRINDTYGHHVGDGVIQSVASQLKHSLRSMDTAARIGGEEFAVILPECAPEDAVRAAARIHSGLNPLPVKYDIHTVHVYSSAGLVWTESGDAVSVKQLLARADEQLYRAKNSGRRRMMHPKLFASRISPAEHASLLLPRLKENPYEP